ncbi:MAG TPA: hypothetical protein VGD66_07235 [Allosphingosinicella sp.]
MAFQFTTFPTKPTNPNAAFVTAGTDGSLWSTATNSLYWYDGSAWQLFVGCDGGITDFAVRQLGRMWGIGQSDANIYYFNGIAWALQTLPYGGATRLALGPNGALWCLDNDTTKPQVWQLGTGGWVKFGHLSATDPTFVSIASGANGINDVFLAALDSSGQIWLCVDQQASWTPMAKLTQGSGKSIAAGADHRVFVIDSAAGNLWRWNAGSSSWEQISDQGGGFTQLSVQEDGRLWTVDSSNTLYSAVEFYPSLKHFRGSDWNNAGTAIYAVHHETTGNYDAIYRSNDGITFESVGCGSLPPVTKSTAYFWFSVPLFIPTAKPGDTEKMLISPIGSQTLYVCDDISKTPLTFAPLSLDSVDTGSAGVWNGFADDAAGNVYVGWYAMDSSENKAILYKSSAAEGYTTWHIVTSWEARHIHTVRVNPFNGYLYVVVGEPRDSSVATDSADSAKVMRSKDGGATWTCLTDTWANTPVEPCAPDIPLLYLGLYFSTLGFIKERVVLGEDTDFKRGRIFYFDDDGRDGTDSAKPLPFTPQPTYQTCNPGEFFLGAASMGDRLYLASQYLAPTQGVVSTRCVSTCDGVTWTLEQVCASVPDINASSMGIITQHPDRAGKLIYALSPTDSFVIAGSGGALETPRSWPGWFRRMMKRFVRAIFSWL